MIAGKKLTLVREVSNHHSQQQQRRRRRRQNVTSDMLQGILAESNSCARRQPKSAANIAQKDDEVSLDQAGSDARFECGTSKISFRDTS